MIKRIEKEIAELLSENKDGHDADHINRVKHLTEKFAAETGADIEKAVVIALLHDADDYKLVGIDNSGKQANARNLLEKCGADESFSTEVLKEISKIGFSKALNGIRPETTEGKIVCDADMCDAMGISGILRTYSYSITHGSKFFDKNKYPRENMTVDEYMRGKDSSGINHLFEKILKLPDYMLTAPGKKEAEKRYNTVVRFLYDYFKEENEMQWIHYLNNYLTENDNKYSSLPHKVVGIKEQGVKYYERPGAYIIPEKDGKIALVKNKNSLFFIGGGKEPGENNKECLRREVLEETGYEVIIGNCFATAEQFKPDQTDIGYFHPYQYYYTGKLTEKVNEKTEDDHNLIWVDKSNKDIELFLEMQQWGLDEYMKINNEQNV